ncbi:MAG: tetratricopeptide (TPR) repeat protein [Myxococcota bacterium]|jgi:tetratricopeptide (TPR) repeat protein
MRHALLAFVLAVPGLAMPSSAAAPAPEAELPISKALPLAKALLGQGVTKLSIPELERGVDQRLSRLLVGGGHAALDTPKDIEELVVLAIQVQALKARGENSRGLRAAALSTAYMVHLAGHAYTTRTHVRESFDALLERLSEDQKPGYRLLLQSLPKMRDYGKSWFPTALSGVQKDDPNQAWVHNQRGLWLFREGRYEQAAEAFAIALTTGMKARYAQSLYRALLKGGKTTQAAELQARTIKLEPMLAGSLEQIRVGVEDDRLTAHYERFPKKATLIESLAQTHRYLRLGRVHAAEVLAAELLASTPGDPKVEDTIAEIYATINKPGRLSALLSTAEKRGPLSVRLREARVAQTIQSRIDKVLEGKAHTMAGHNVTEDVAAIAAVHGEQSRILAVLPDVLAAIAGWINAGNAGAMEPTKAHIAALEAAIDKGYALLPKSPEMVLLATAGYIALDQSDTAMRKIPKWRRKLAAADRGAIDFLLARMQVGYGVRRLDKALLAKGVRSLAKLNAGPGVPKHELAYALVVSRAARQVLDGKSLPEKGTAKKPGVRDVLAALPRHDLDFDVISAAGALHAKGVALTYGALLLALDDQGTARDALKEVRRVDPDSALAKLAAGQAALIGGDGGGALQLLYEGLGRAGRPSEVFAMHKWIAYTANLVNDQQRAAHHIGAMLKMWDDAAVPASVSPRSPRPLFIGDFHVGVLLKPGEPLRPELRANPLVVLVADVPHKKSELEQLVRDAAKSER